MTGSFPAAVFLQRIHRQQRQIRVGLRVVRDVVIEHLLRRHVRGVGVHDDIGEYRAHVNADSEVLDDLLKQLATLRLLLLRGPALRCERP